MEHPKTRSESETESQHTKDLETRRIEEIRTRVEITRDRRVQSRVNQGDGIRSGTLLVSRFGLGWAFLGEVG